MQRLEPEHLSERSHAKSLTFAVATLARGTVHPSIVQRISTTPNPVHKATHLPLPLPLPLPISLPLPLPLPLPSYWTDPSPSGNLCIMQNPPLPVRFDQSRFQRLLDLIGPTERPAFLAQLVQDLTACADAIAQGAGHLGAGRQSAGHQGAKGQDWDALREASHVLVSLAGSLGAMSLHGLAQAMNQAAQQKDATALAQGLPDLQRDLSALLALVGATPSSVPSPSDLTSASDLTSPPDPTNPATLTSTASAISPPAPEPTAPAPHNPTPDTSTSDHPQ